MTLFTSLIQSIFSDDANKCQITSYSIKTKNDFFFHSHPAFVIFIKSRHNVFIRVIGSAPTSYF